MSKPSEKMIESVAQELEEAGIKVYNSEELSKSKLEVKNKISQKDWFNFITKSQDVDAEDITKFVGNREISLDQLMCLCGLLRYSILYSKNVVVNLYVNLSNEDRLKLKISLSGRYDKLYASNFKDLCLDREWILQMISSFDSYDPNDISYKEEIVSVKESAKDKIIKAKDIVGLIKEYNIDYLAAGIIGLTIGLILSAFIFGMLIIIF